MSFTLISNVYYVSSDIEKIMRFHVFYLLPFLSHIFIHLLIICLQQSLFWLDTLFHSFVVFFDILKWIAIKILGFAGAIFALREQNYKRWRLGKNWFGRNDETTTQPRQRIGTCQITTPTQPNGKIEFNLKEQKMIAFVVLYYGIK